MTTKRFVLPVVGAVAAAGLSAVGTMGVVVPAHAADPLTDAVVVGAEEQARITVAVASGSHAIEDQDFNDFSPHPADAADPYVPDPYVVLSTGNAADFLLGAALSSDNPETAELDPQPEPSTPSQSTDRGGDGVPDSTTLTITVAEPASAVANECLYVDFALGSEQTLGGAEGDTLSIKRTSPASNTEYALNTDGTYPTQSIQGYETWPVAPVPYSTAITNYWHRPGDLKFDVHNGQLNTPRLERWTRLNNVTTRDTARVPLDFSGAAQNTVSVVVADAPNDGGFFDTAAMIDHVRLANCGVGAGPTPVPYGVNEGSGSIKGQRKVGYPLTYDPIPNTPAIERYDATDNGWTTPSGEGHVELRFRWYRTKFNCTTQQYSPDFDAWSPIPNADRQSYVPDVLDYDRCLIVLVTGVADGFAMATRPLISESQTNSDRWYVTSKIGRGTFLDGSTPTIVLDEADTDDRPGQPEVGETLVAKPVATRPLQDSWTYKWYADGFEIAGATDSSFTLGSNQLGKRITVVATAIRVQFDSRPFTSQATTPVLGSIMESRGGVVITPAAPVQGDDLTAEPGPICDVPEPSGGACDGKWPLGTSFKYQWTRDGQNIVGAEGPTYKTSTIDVGKTIRVKVLGSKTGYDPVGPDPSLPVAAVQVSGLAMTGAEPVITGNVRVGQTVTGSLASAWLPSGSSMSYEWWVGGVKVQSGFNSSYMVPATAAGKSLVLKVTGTKAGYETMTRASAPVTVAKGILSATVPKISGLAKVGQTVFASPGFWGPFGVKLSYRWKVGGVAVSGSAGSQSSFKIPRSARGKRITVTVTGKLAGYTTKKKTSEPTAKVTR